MDSRFQIQQEEDGGGSTGQSWMETSKVKVNVNVNVDLYSASS